MSDPLREYDADVAATTVHVREWGPRDGRPLLFWHGLGSYTGLYLADVAEGLSARGLRVLAIDPPGVGGSPELPAAGYEFPSLGDFAADLIDALGIGPCVFMGHSWGGLVGCHLAAQHPHLVDALVLLDGGYRDASEADPTTAGRSLEQEVEQARRDDRSFGSWDEFHRFLHATFPDLSTAAKAAWSAGMTERDGLIVDTMSAQMIGAATHGYRRAPATSLQPAIDRSGVPVLLLIGGREADQAAQEAADRFAAAVSRADVRIVPGASHDLVFDLGPRLAATVCDWLAGGWYEQISAAGLMDVLQPYQPVAVGAHPLGLARSETPVEIVCRATDLPAFARTIERAYGDRDGFALHGGSLDTEPAVFAEFRLGDLEVQVAGQAEHVHRRLGAATLGVDRALAQAPAHSRARIASAVARGEDWLEAAMHELGLSRVALESLATANAGLVRRVMGRPQPAMPLREYVIPVLVGIVAMGLIVVASLSRGAPSLIGIMALVEAFVLGAIWGARLGIVAALAPLVLVGLDIGGSIAVGSESCSPNCGAQVAEGLFVAVLVASAAGIAGLVRDRYFPRNARA